MVERIHFGKHATKHKHTCYNEEGDEVECGLDKDGNEIPKGIHKQKNLKVVPVIFGIALFLMLTASTVSADFIFVDLGGGISEQVVTVTGGGGEYQPFTFDLLPGTGYERSIYATNIYTETLVISNVNRLNVVTVEFECRNADESCKWAYFIVNGVRKVAGGRTMDFIVDKGVDTTVNFGVQVPSFLLGQSYGFSLKVAEKVNTTNFQSVPYDLKISLIPSDTQDLLIRFDNFLKTPFVFGAVTVYGVHLFLGALLGTIALAVILILYFLKRRRKNKERERFSRQRAQGRGSQPPGGMY